MVDPDRQAVTVCRPGVAGSVGVTSELMASAGEVLASPLLPGFSLALGGLFPPPEPLA